MSVIFLFIDGVGLGSDSPSNPFYIKKYRGFSAMCGYQPFTESAKEVRDNSFLFKPIDACLGVEGLPQSGTGQASLLSGENAAREIGKHFGPFPHSGIKHLLKEQSLFNKAQKINKSCHFINAYPEIFFRKATKRDRWSCTTLMARSADVVLNTTEDVKNGKAITAGITQEAWRDHLNIKVPVIEPETAANRLLKQSERFDLLLHEYYLSDKAGHSQNSKHAESVLSIYDRFLCHLIRNKSRNTTLILSSDHGNVEDLSTKTHTFNKVPLFVSGSGTELFASAESIIDVTPAIIRLLKITNQSIG